MPVRLRPSALVALAAALAAAACGPAPDAGLAGGRLDTPGVASKDELFAADTFYFVRIDGWDPAKMSVAALDEETTVPGATVKIYRSNSASPTHCPDAEVAPGDLVWATTAFSLRTSGNLTDGTPKSSYKLAFKGKQARLLGMKSLNLKSMWNDVSQMREALVWRLFAAAGIAAPRQTYAKFCIGAKYYGLYSLIEQIDSSFLGDHFGADSDGNLYKAYWADIGPADLTYRGPAGTDYFTAADNEARSYRLQSNNDPTDDAKLQTYDDLARLVAVLNGRELDGEPIDSETYRSQIESVFDVRGYLRWASLNLLLGAWDNYWGTPGNYYLYNSGRAGAADFMAAPYFTWIPWDYDISFGWDQFHAGWQYKDIVDWQQGSVDYYRGLKHSELPLITHLLENGPYLEYYLDSMEYLLDTVFNEEWITAQIGREGESAAADGLWTRVRQAAFLEADGQRAAPHTGRQFTNDQVYWNGFRHQELDRGDNTILGILHYVRMRHDSAKAQLATLRVAHPRGASGGQFPASPTPLPAP